MTWLKNILLVSYLKNKGVWRICFVVGCLLVLLMVVTTPKFYNTMRIDKEYLNIVNVKDWIWTYREANPNRSLALAECTDKYFSALGLEGAMFSLYTENPVAWYCSVSTPEKCQKFRVIANDKIRLDCGKADIFVYRTLLTVLFFYFPFLIGVLLKFLWAVLLWIARGLKEEKM